MRHFRGVSTLIQNTQNKFPNTLPTQDPTNSTLQTNQNKPVQDIEVQQIQLHQPTMSSHYQNKGMHRTTKQDLCQQAKVPNQVPKLDTPNLQGEQVHRKNPPNRSHPYYRTQHPTSNRVYAAG